MAAVRTCILLAAIWRTSHAVDDCDSPANVERIHRWFRGELDAADLEFDCSVARTVGEAAGGVAGAVAGVAGGASGGAALGRAFGEAVRSVWQTSNEDVDNMEAAGALLGSVLGGVFGGVVGSQLGGHAAMRMHTMFRTGSTHSAIVAECEQMMRLTPPYSHKDIVRAYREAARTAHPDGGGSNEGMVKLTVCREVLTCAADPSHCERSDG